MDSSTDYNYNTRLYSVRSKLESMFSESYTLRNASRIRSLVEQVVNQEKKYSSLDEERFSVLAKSKTYEFRTKLDKGSSIESIMVDALAIACEATRRSFGYDEIFKTQIETAIAMIGDTFEVKEGTQRKDIHQRVIAQMKTGEGKTVVQILTGYLNTLEATKNKSDKKSVHILTANDALAERDSNANRKVYELLGLSCGFVPSRRFMTMHNMKMRDFIAYKKRQYQYDVVYSTAEAVAFDYLEDTLVHDPKDKYMQKPFGYVIVDEADDILIDKATNDLILVENSKSVEDLDNVNKMKDIYLWATNILYGDEKREGLSGTEFDQYETAKNKVFTTDYAYIKDEQKVRLNDRAFRLLEEGIDKEDTDTYTQRMIALENCIIAKHSFLNGREYTVEKDPATKTGKITIIDANTGRKKENSVYDGLIQLAIEAKEDYDLKKSNYQMQYQDIDITKGRITYPDFINLYSSGVCGMTGTSDIEEFKDLYSMQTYTVPTNKPSRRIIEQNARLYTTLEYKDKAILEEVKRVREKGQPVLIGTSSVVESQRLYELLSKNHINANLLNAENDYEENEIIKNAGLYGAVTVATNMAGRGTDIKLGGNDPEQKRIIKENGGLLVISTSYNKSERIDNQLMGRAGRQGDPGRCVQFCSLEDELVKRYYPEKEGKKNSLEIIKNVYSHDDGKIESKALQKIVKDCQRRKMAEDKNSRVINLKLGSVLESHRKNLLVSRDEVLNANNDEVEKITDVVIDRYANMLANLSEEEVSLSAGHLINAEECFDKNKGAFAEKIKKQLYERMSNTVITTLRNIQKRIVLSNIAKEHDLKSLSTDELRNLIINAQKDKELMETVDKEQKEYLENQNKDLKEKYLKIIDSHWLEHMEEVNNIRSRISFAPVVDPILMYEKDSNDSLFNRMYPFMYNEMVTYACNGNLDYGIYKLDKTQEKLMV